MLETRNRQRRHNDGVRAGANRKPRFRWLLLGVGAGLLFAAPAQAETGGFAAPPPGGTPTATSSENVLPNQGIAFGTMRSGGATWYGPGFYGNRTACGQVLRPHTIGVAHRSLPCGTAVRFSYRGRYIITTVIDRGPYANGYVWDLTNGARAALGFEGSDQLRYSIARRLPRG
jgi:rare lipoprotein A (peptidoglycan hydrolase)